MLPIDCVFLCYTVWREGREMKKGIISRIMLMTITISILAVVNVINVEPTQASVDWWFMFRHDENRTGFSFSNVSLPLILFKNFTITSAVKSSPAVFNDAVFVGSLDGYVYRWDMKTFELKKSSKFGAIYSSPAVVEGVVYIGSDDGYVYALYANSLVVIRNYSTGGAVKSSPVNVDGVLYVGSSDGYFYAWEVSTGTELWRYRTTSPIESSPAVYGDTIVFGTDDGRVYALEKTGRIKWYFQTNGPVVSSPAVANGVVFVGSNDTKIYALNATNGHEIWNYKTDGPVVSSPAVAFGMVFVGSVDGYLYTLNATSALLTPEERLLRKNSTMDAITSSPAVSADGKVFVGSNDKRIYAFDAYSGEQLWNYGTGGSVKSSPAIAKGMVFVGSDDGKVYIFVHNTPPVAKIAYYPESPIVTQQVTFDGSQSYDNDTNDYITQYIWDFGDGTPKAYGKIVTHTYYSAKTYNIILTVIDTMGANGTTSQPLVIHEAWPMFRHDPTHIGYTTSLAPIKNDTIWTVKIGPPVIGELWMYPSAAIVRNTIFISSTNYTVYAVDINGTVIWKRTLDPYRIYSSPAVSDGLVFVGNENGYVYALNATNGEIKWSKPVSTGTPIYSSPIVVDNVLFVGSQNERVYALDKNTGNILRYSPYLGGAIDSSPAVAGGRLFVGSNNGSIYALNQTTLSIIWNFPTPTHGPVKSSPAMLGDMVLVGSADGKLYALKATSNNPNGEVKWSYQTGGEVRSSSAIAYGMVFVGSMDGNIYAINVTTGEKIWSKPIGEIGWSSPAVAEGKVFVGSRNKKVYALNAKDGSIIWSYQTGGPVESSPSILDDILYIGSQDGFLYAFHSEVHDIAILNVTSSKNWVYQGEPVDITVTLRNEGTFNETEINVAVYFNSSLLDSRLINVSRGEIRTINFQWDTSLVEPANYTISANATLKLTSDDDPTDNSFTNGIVSIKSRIQHDIAIKYVISLKTVVCQNYIMNIDVSVENQGDFTETFNVTLYANATVIETKQIALANGASTILTFTWDTTGFVKGNYTIWAYASPVPGEIDTSDNTFVDGWVVVAMVGDINADGIVDIFDCVKIALAFSATPHDPNWDPNADIDNSYLTDIFDLVIVAIHFAETDP
jgi:outer membrane protein assembly factor BamB